MHKVIFLLILSSCAIHDFRSNVVFNDIYDGPKIEFLDPEPNSMISNDAIPLSFQISHPMGIRYAHIVYSNQEKKYSYDAFKYPTTATINESLSVSNSGPITVSIRAVTGKNTELITNINYNMQITTTYFTLFYGPSTSLPTAYVQVTFLPTSAPASRIVVDGPMGTEEVLAPPGGFGSTARVSNLNLDFGNNHFTLRVISIYGRISHDAFTVFRI
ncbi:hypothetical protein SAMN02745150_01053 [Brevinema andersonii]|uniref:Uncharacterized protein n=1 Tax=Brevinema andersonii TaxID=34097 RepID=A0A1I1EHH9_BREAD|nr:hypothetical protein [Brevinema andersonii]SFB84838.1 hypothetical protein SAMN02745150_01053 [Brevinema andersonii]